MKFSLPCVAALFAATALATPVSNDVLEKREYVTVEILHL
jgi:hypothetical protein